MINAFIDPDLILEVLTKKEPDSNESAMILSMAEKKEVKLFMGAQSYGQIYHVLRQFASHDKVVEQMNILAELIEVGVLDKKAVSSALKSNFSNLEDAIQNYCAESNNVKILITRRHKDYKSSGLSIMSPALFLEMV